MFKYVSDTMTQFASFHTMNAGKITASIHTLPAGSTRPLKATDQIDNYTLQYSAYLPRLVGHGFFASSGIYAQ